MPKRPIIGLSMNFMKLGSYHQHHIRDTYVDAIYEHGAVPLLIPCIANEDVLNRYLDMVGMVIIIGGLDYPSQMYGQEPHPTLEEAHPRRVASDPMLFLLAMQRKIPVLGICAGLQLMNIALGGQLIQHLDTVDAHYGEKYHRVQIQNSRWLSQIFPEGEMVVNSNHHQGIHPDYLGEGLVPVAYSEDGLIEAMEFTSDQFAVGIQWHPERITTEAEFAQPFAAEPAIWKGIEEHRKRMFDFLVELAGKKD